MPPRSPTGSLPANDSACQGRPVGRSHELLSTAGPRGRPAVAPSSERHVPRPWGPIRVGHPVPFSPVAGSRALLHPVWHAAQLAPRAAERSLRLSAPIPSTRHNRGNHGALPKTISSYADPARGTHATPVCGACVPAFIASRMLVNQNHPQRTRLPETSQRCSQRPARTAIRGTA